MTARDSVKASPRTGYLTKPCRKRESRLNPKLRAMCALSSVVYVRSYCAASHDEGSFGVSVLPRSRPPQRRRKSLTSKTQFPDRPWTLVENKNFANRARLAAQSGHVVVAAEQETANDSGCGGQLVISKSSSACNSPGGPIIGRIWY